MDESKLHDESQERVALPPDGDETDEVRPWEEIDTGRYMPRRIRGSCRGMQLG
jgi:hypothetical protein